MRIIVSCLAAATFAFPVRMISQEIDPVSVSPDKYRVLLENDRVRVVEYTIKAGERDNPHTHPAKVSYVAEGGTLRIVLADTSFLSEEGRGDISFRGRVPRHYAENVGSTTTRIILFEVKRVDARVAPADQDAYRNNPSTLTVKLENDSVRVMEAVIPPGHREKQHTHPPYAMYVLGGGSVRMHLADGTTRDVEFKAGEARFSEAVTHWAENTGTSTVRVVLVELRDRHVTRQE
jgi:beta-alanine degradation protein BauB